MKAVASRAKKVAKEARIPRNLSKQIEDVIVEDPEVSWDEALANLAKEAIDAEEET